MSTTIPAQIAHIREAQGRLGCDIAETVGVSPASISLWDAGKVSPLVVGVSAYAHAVGYYIGVHRNGRVVAELVDALPNLGRLRKAAGRTQAVVAGRLGVNPPGVTSLERRARRGVPAQLDTIQRFLEACGYELGLFPVEVEAVAA